MSSPRKTFFVLGFLILVPDCIIAATLTGRAGGAPDLKNICGKKTTSPLAFLNPTDVFSDDLFLVKKNLFPDEDRARFYEPIQPAVLLEELKRCPDGRYGWPPLPPSWVARHAWPDPDLFVFSDAIEKAARLSIIKSSKKSSSSDSTPQRSDTKKQQRLLLHLAWSAVVFGRPFSSPIARQALACACPLLFRTPQTATLRRQGFVLLLSMFLLPPPMGDLSKSNVHRVVQAALYDIGFSASFEKDVASEEEDHINATGRLQLVARGVHNSRLVSDDERMSCPPGAFKSDPFLLYRAGVAGLLRMANLSTEPASDNRGAGALTLVRVLRERVVGGASDTMDIASWGSGSAAVENVRLVVAAGAAAGEGSCGWGGGAAAREAELEVLVSRLRT